MPIVKPSQALLQFIKQATLNENSILFPSNKYRFLSKIDKDNLHQIMVNATGKKESETCYSFLFNPLFLHEKLVATGNVNIANDFQFYPTHKEVVNSHLLNGLDLSGKKALEPSAGCGNIASEMRDKGAQVYCVEIMQEMCECLMLNGFEIIGSDFMLLDTSLKFDIIIANPPFCNSQDIKHITKMYDHLAKGGTLRAIMSTTSYNGSNKQAKEFRSWLSEKGTCTDLGRGLFAYLGTNVGVSMIEIVKI